MLAMATLGEYAGSGKSSVGQLQPKHHAPSACRRGSPQHRHAAGETTLPPDFDIDAKRSAF
jgi:hypothetical protein